MAHYLIEFRFQGKARYEFKELIHHIDKAFRIGHARKQRPVPHISLAGPFTTNNERRLISDVYKVCEYTLLMNCLINGFDYFKNSRTAFVSVNPSQLLDEFRWKLSKTLQPYCKLQDYDYKRDFAFHITIAKKLDPIRFEAIKEYIDSFDSPSFKYFIARVTIIKNQLILKEYDFFLRRLLNRHEAKNKKVYSMTIDSIQKYLQGKYDPDRFIKAKKYIVTKSIVEKIKDLFAPRRIFITSDLHLDHTNIIKYCNRPFKNTHEMNRTLINNWNNIVRKRDIVYFLGDLAYGRGSKPTDYWLKKLNGKVIFIKGNHDKSHKIKIYDNYILNYKGIKFYLTHDLEDIPKDWKGWAISGHHHNNYPDKYPLIAKNKKRINISTELTGYRPVDIREIMQKMG